MSFTPESRIKIITLLNVMGSPIDEEALSAIRALQDYLKEQKLDWYDVIAFPKEPVREKRENEIEEMFEVCMEHTWGEGREFIESIYSYYEENGFLTPKQKSALEKFYENCSAKM